MDITSFLPGTAIFELKMSHTGPDEGLHYWLSLDGIPVAYAKVYERTTATGPQILLCDIETRAGHRNRGYATELLEQIASGYGVTAVSHGGSYTADGFNYIAAKLKRIGEPAAGPSHSAMGFVDDWDTMLTKFS